jgi:hypothetical protein
MYRSRGPAVQGVEGELVSTDETWARCLDAWLRHLTSCSVCRPFTRVFCDDGARLYTETSEEGERRDRQSEAGVQTGDIPTYEDLHGEQEGEK